MRHTFHILQGLQVLFVKNAQVRLNFLFFFLLNQVLYHFMGFLCTVSSCYLLLSFLN